MAALVPHLEALPEAQQRLWPTFQPLAGLGFVLYGGTAVSLRYGHRQSVDFDFFSDRPLDRAALAQGLPWLASAIVLQESTDTLTVLAGESGLSNGPSATVKVSFFGGLAFGRLAAPDTTLDGVAQVASPQDLLATKLKVLLQRVEAKDYQDVATLLESGADLAGGLAGARVMYGSAFQPAECLKALVYFEGGDLDTLPAATRTALMGAVASTGPLPRVTIVAHTLAAPV
ncbi:MAG TPA: nucleotidyl transferase AbiEii/AbiGii toxin family protein [Ktedonobacterales bacterium]